MKFSHLLAAFLTTTALLSSQAAQSADAIYVGDCIRAKAVHLQSKIDMLLPYTSYEGTYRGIYAKEVQPCDTDQLILYSLKERSRSANAIVFDTERKDFNFGKGTGCGTGYFSDKLVVGTATFTTRLQQKGEVCEVVIWSEWAQRRPSDPAWSGNFRNFVTTLDGGALVISQLVAGAYEKGDYRTPVVFTPVKPQEN